jgi:hypothetical protein
VLRVEREDVRARHDTLVRPAEDQAARPSSKTKQQDQAARARAMQAARRRRRVQITYRTATATRRSVSETVTQSNRQTRRDETTRDVQRAQAASSRGIQDKGSRTGRAGGSSAPTPPCSTRSARPRAPPRPTVARTHTRAHTHTYTTKAHVIRACLSEKATACCFCKKTRFQMLSYVSVCVPQVSPDPAPPVYPSQHITSHQTARVAQHGTARRNQPKRHVSTSINGCLGCIC